MDCDCELFHDNVNDAIELHHLVYRRIQITHLIEYSNRDSEMVEFGHQKRRNPIHSAARSVWNIVGLFRILVALTNNIKPIISNFIQILCAFCHNQIFNRGQTRVRNYVENSESNWKCVIINKNIRFCMSINTLHRHNTAPFRRHKRSTNSCENSILKTGFYWVYSEHISLTL